MTTFIPTTEPITEVKADLIVLPAFEGRAPGPGAREVGRALGVDLLDIAKSAGFDGKEGESFFLPGAARQPAVLLLGLGSRTKVTADTIRRAGGRAAASLGRARRAATTLPLATRDGAEAAQALVEGVLLGGYRFEAYKSKKGDVSKLRELVLGVKETRGASGGVRRARVVAEAVAFTRDLVNTPSLDATPEWMADRAKTMARSADLRVKVWTPAELERGGFGGILGVGRGSANAPRMVELRYGGGRKDQAPIGLVGKGITFDSGGLSIKTAKQMEWMKADKAGASAMLGVMQAIGHLKPKINVMAAIPLSENMPSGSAIRPGDVLHHRGGKTSEVLNTDAEGRLVMADALAFLNEKKPAALIDAATLTGACMVALGDQVYGVMGNDEKLVRQILTAGTACGEPGWELPLWEGYRKALDSDVADVKNIGGPYGGAITAGLFLREFVGTTPWAHLDIAGTAYATSAGDYWPKGATGSPVRTIVRFLLDRAGRR